MFYTPRRRTAVLALILSLSPTITGCMGTTQVPLDASTDLTRVTGVISRSGTHTVFASPGATITNETLYAIGLVAGGVAACAIAFANSGFLSH